MKRSPGERPGATGKGRHQRPSTGKEPMLAGRFRTWPFFVRPQSVFANGRRSVRRPEPSDTGRYRRFLGSVQFYLIPSNLLLIRVNFGLVANPPTHPPTVGDRDLELAFARLDNRRESPAAPVAARYVEVGGCGGIPGGWQRRSRPVGTGNDDGGKPQRRLSVARLTPFPVSCLLRHLSGSATPMMAGTGAKRAKSGVSR